MHERVADEVRHDLVETGVVALHDDAASGHHIDGPFRRDRLGVLRRVLHERHEVDRCPLERSSLVEARQVEQVVHERPHPNGLLLGPPHGVVELCRLREGPGAVELRVPADGRDGSPELVRGIGDELPEAGLGLDALVEGVLDATEHPVEGHAEVPGLGSGRALRNALRQVASRDGAGGLGHPLHRSHPQPDHPPHHEGQHAQHREHRGRLDGDQAPHRLVDVVERERDDGGAAVPQLDALPHPVVDLRIVARDGDDLPALERIDRAIVEARRGGLGVGQPWDGHELAVGRQDPDVVAAQGRGTLVVPGIPEPAGPVADLLHAAAQLGIDLVDEVRSGGTRDGDGSHLRARAR